MAELQVINQERMKSLNEKKVTDTYKETEALLLKMQELDQKYTETKKRREKKDIEQSILIIYGQSINGRYSYYEINCELNLRMIMDKHLKGEKLSEGEIDTAGKYLFFSTLPFPHDGPSMSDLLWKSMFGAGNFSSKELNLITDISNILDKTNNKDYILM